MMDLPKENTSYKLKEHWDTRFSKEETFEWCKSYGDFKDLLCKHPGGGGHLGIFWVGMSRPGLQIGTPF